MRIPTSIDRRWAAALLLGAALAHPTSAQGPDAEPLRLTGVSVAGPRQSATESWGTLRVDLTNRGSEGCDARVVVFYPERPEVHYARDVFVPARSAVVTWMSIGPAPKQSGPVHRDVEVLLFDRTGGHERRIPPPGGEKVHSRPLFYRPREPTTIVLPPEGTDDPEAVQLARTFRQAAGLSEAVGTVSDKFLPPVPEAFDGIDVLVVAGDRLNGDPAGRQAVRRWVQQGGTLWVRLDRVNPDGMAPLLGDDFDVGVIDRVGLTTVRLHRAVDDPATGEARDHDRPVEMVRVSPGATDTVLHTANGWPASFVRTVGRGRVLFTTLGARGWHRPRTARDSKSPYERFPDLPLALNPLADLAVRTHPRNEVAAVPTEALRDVLLPEVGYTVVGRGTAAAVFGIFAVGLIGLGVGLRRSHRPERLGWLAPAAAVGAAAIFIGLGEASRRAVPPTVGVAAVVDAVPGFDEVTAAGVVAVYRPGSGPVPLATDRGTMLDLDLTGIDGPTQQRVATDIDAWHWQGLTLPAGVRTGTFRSTLTGNRLSAAARFGPGGLDGRLATGPFTGPADGLILTPGRESLPVSFGDGDAFTVRGDDVLPTGQYVSSAVLTDRQQRRQTVYRQLLGGLLPRHWENRTLLLAWAEPGEPPFRVAEGDRVVGTVLLVVPLEFERPPADTSLTIPPAFVPCSRILRGRPRPPTVDGSAAIEMELRFQLPASVLPMAVEKVRFTAKVRTPGRHFTVTAPGEAGPVEVFDAEGPLDPIRVEIADPRLLRIDPEGGLRLTVKVGEQIRPPVELPPATTPPPPEKKPFEGKGPPVGKGKFEGKGPPGGKGQSGGKGAPPSGPRGPEVPPDLLWKIESLGLEVVGRTGP